MTPSVSAVTSPTSSPPSFYCFIRMNVWHLRHLFIYLFIQRCNGNRLQIKSLIKARSTVIPSSASFLQASQPGCCNWTPPRFVLWNALIAPSLPRCSLWSSASDLITWIQPVWLKGWKQCFLLKKASPVHGEVQKSVSLCFFFTQQIRCNRQSDSFMKPTHLFIHRL